MNHPSNQNNSCSPRSNRASTTPRPSGSSRDAGHGALSIRSSATPGQESRGSSVIPSLGGLAAPGTERESPQYYQVNLTPGTPLTFTPHQGPANIPVTPSQGPSISGGSKTANLDVLSSPAYTVPGTPLERGYTESMSPYAMIPPPDRSLKPVGGGREDWLPQSPPRTMGPPLIRKQPETSSRSSKIQPTKNT